MDAKARPMHVWQATGGLTYLNLTDLHQFLTVNRNLKRATAAHLRLHERSPQRDALDGYLRYNSMIVVSKDANKRAYGCTVLVPWASNLGQDVEKEISEMGCTQCFVAGTCMEILYKTTEPPTPRHQPPFDSLQTLMIKPRIIMDDFINGMRPIFPFSYSIFFPSELLSARLLAVKAALEREGKTAIDQVKFFNISKSRLGWRSLEAHANQATTYMDRLVTSHQMMNGRPATTELTVWMDSLLSSIAGTMFAVSMEALSSWSVKIWMDNQVTTCLRYEQTPGVDGAPITTRTGLKHKRA
jgi:hypothetical protein